jgi:hypothetical protein
MAKTFYKSIKIWQLTAPGSEILSKNMAIIFYYIFKFLVKEKMANLFLRRKKRICFLKKFPLSFLSVAKM